MSLLREAANEQARAKIGIYGEAGSGKTTTLALLAIGLSKTYHNGAPVAMLDSENGSDFLVPIFAAEGIKLVVHKSRAFIDLCAVVKEAQEAGCCALIVDSLTHTWRELVETYCARKAEQYKKSSYEPQFSDWNYLKAEWGVWTRLFVNSQIHCLVAGRGGYEWDFQVNDKGKRELVKGDSKMKVEGEFGYEPNLSLEATKERVNTSDGHGGQFEHILFVLKDKSWALTGKEFKFPDVNAYAQGYWKAVYNAFAPHFQFLNIAGTQRAISSATSDDMFDENNDGEARQRMQAKKIALEEIENLMGVILWPGATNEVKRLKLGVLQALFGVRSWAAVETMPVLKIENALFALQMYENIKPYPEGEEAIVAKVKECFDFVAAEKGVSMPLESSKPPHIEPQVANPPIVEAPLVSEPLLERIDMPQGKRKFAVVRWGGKDYSCWVPSVVSELALLVGKPVILHTKENGEWVNVTSFELPALQQGSR